MKTRKRKSSNWIIYTVAASTVVVLLSVVLVLQKTGVISLEETAASIIQVFKVDRSDPDDNESSSVVSSQDTESDSDTANSSAPESNDNIALSLPSFMKAIYFDAAEELDLTKSIYSIKSQLRSKLLYFKGLGMNTCIYYNVTDPDISKAINEALKENDIYSFAVYSLNSENTLTTQGCLKEADEVKNFFSGYAPDAVILDNYYNTYDEVSEASQLTEMTDYRLSVIKKALKLNNPYVAVGLMCDPVNLNSDFGAVYSFEANTDGYFDLSLMSEEDLPDCVIVKAPFSINNTSVPYEKFLDYWNSLASEKGFNFYSLLYNDKLFSASDWLNPVEIVKQLIASTEREEYNGVAFNSLDGLIANRQTSTAALIKYMYDDLDEAAIMKELTITEPTSRTFTTSEDRVLFRGTTDINFDVIINGQPAARNGEGDFASYVSLKVGTNKITFQHKGKTIVYTITRTVVVLKEVSPTATVVLDGSTVLAIEATAYTGSTVTATIKGTKINLTADGGSSAGTGSMYSVYRGSYTLPEATEEEQDLGVISFYGTYNGISGSKNGAAVIVKAKPKLPETAGEMLMVSNSNLPFSYSGSSTYYFPCPDQSFLPYGTLDYIDGEPFVIKDGADVYTFIKTRSGKRFQTKDVTMLETADMGNNAVNSATCVAEGTYLSFNFNMNWNVPFNITANGISYRKLNYQDFNITSFSPNKLVISFDYTDYVENFTLPENSLFESYHWEKTTDGKYDLVLTLKNKNCYTGYVASYSEDGQLNIKFNLPLSYQASENEYGTSLKGTVIALSAGHGGGDPGALATHDGKIYKETELNTAIVNKLKTELEAAGATVVLCNALGANNLPDYRARSNQATAAGAQIHIVIHQNSTSSSSSYGFETWYYSPFSYQLGNYMLDAMQNFYRDTLYSGSYKNDSRRGNFFSWISDTMYPTCPTILLETGFLSNPKECLALSNSETQAIFAKELTKGIIEYAKAQS